MAPAYDRAVPDAPGAAPFRVPAEAYDRYMGRYAPALSAALVEAAGISRGDRALDVGCGPGGLTRTLADLLGPGNVAAVDPSESFVEACRRRVPGARVELATAEALPFEADEFDVALAQLVVNFMADPLAGVGEMRRVTRAGGRVGAAVWDYREGMTMLRTYFDAALTVDPDAPDEGVTMRNASREELEQLWRAAGLRDVESGALDVAAGYAGFEDFWEPFTLGVGPGGAHCVSLSQGARASVREECRRLLGDPQGPFELAARAWYVVGRA